MTSFALYKHRVKLRRTLVLHYRRISEKWSSLQFRVLSPFFWGGGWGVGLMINRILDLTKFIELWTRWIKYNFLLARCSHNILFFHLFNKFILNTEPTFVWYPLFFTADITHSLQWSSNWILCIYTQCSVKYKEA